MVIKFSLNIKLDCKINNVINFSFADAELWKTKFAEAQEIVRTKCSIYTQDLSSDDESSITRSEDTDSPEPKRNEKILDKDAKNVETDEKESDGVVLKLKDLKVESAE